MGAHIAEKNRTMLENHMGNVQAICRYDMQKNETSAYCLIN